jgi:putative peptide zinc metalloprotease protein
VEDTSERLAEIRFPEATVRDIAPEGDATAKLWAFPGHAFDAHVKSIAPSAEEGQDGRIVRVQMTLADPGDQLKSGMTGHAKVDAGWHLAGVVYTRALARFLFVRSWSWVP